MKTKMRFVIGFLTVATLALGFFVVRSRAANVPPANKMTPLEALTLTRATARIVAGRSQCQQIEMSLAPTKQQIAPILAAYQLTIPELLDAPPDARTIVEDDGTIKRGKAESSTK